MYAHHSFWGWTWFLFSRPLSKHSFVLFWRGHPFSIGVGICTINGAVQEWEGFQILSLWLIYSEFLIPNDIFRLLITYSICVLMPAGWLLNWFIQTQLCNLVLEHAVGSSGDNVRQPADLGQCNYLSGNWVTAKWDKCSVCIALATPSLCQAMGCLAHSPFFSVVWLGLSTLSGTAGTWK